MMNIDEQPSWMVFSGEENNLESCKVGKWMYFFDATEVSLLFIRKVCVTAIEERIIVKCKYTSPELCMLKGSGMACFYINSDDVEGHQRLLHFFMAHYMIPKNKSGRFRNIAFKTDMQTRNGDYGNAFKSTLKLSDFVDLDTGQMYDL